MWCFFWLVQWQTPLLILRSVGKIFVFVSRLILYRSVQMPLPLTFWGLAKCGIFSTTLQSKHQSSNLAQMFIRSTSPRISPNPCYRLPFCRGVSCRVGCAIGVFLFFQKEGKKKMKF